MLSPRASRDVVYLPRIARDNSLISLDVSRYRFRTVSPPDDLSQSWMGPFLFFSSRDTFASVNCKSSSNSPCSELRAAVVYDPFTNDSLGPQWRNNNKKKGKRGPNDTRMRNGRLADKRNLLRCFFSLPGPLSSRTRLDIIPSVRQFAPGAEWCQTFLMGLCFLNGMDPRGLYRDTVDSAVTRRCFVQLGRLCAHSAREGCSRALAPFRGVVHDNGRYG